MASKGPRKPPLVADRRYTAKKPSSGGKPSSRTEPKLTGGRGGGGGGKGSSGSGGRAKTGATARRAAPRKRVRRVPKTRLGRFLAFLWRPFGWLFGALWWIGWRAGALAALALAAVVLYEAAMMPPAASRLDARRHGSVTFLDRDGKVFAWRGEHFGSIDAKNVSPWLKDAVIATEDKRFYHHFGVSPRGILGAMLINLREGRGPFSGNGGSTITQQASKLLCAGVDYDPNRWKSQRSYEDYCRQATLSRKVKEAVYALAMELRYSKDQILTIYFNRVFLGSGAQGFEAASERYFDISASKLNPSQAAMLAGLLVAPTRYAPTNDLKRSQARAATVIRLMEEQGYLTKAQADDAQAHPATVAKGAVNRSGDWFADWVMSTAPSWLTNDTTEDVIIKTTFDPYIQASADAAVHDVFDKKVKDGSTAEVALVVMSPDGAVRAVVGGRDTGAAGAFNRATQALRQTGSAFKPFVYAAALEAGYSPDATVDDMPLTIDVPGSGPWSPKNYGGEYMGRVTLTTALAHSLNTATVRVSEAIGRDKVRDIAIGLGMPTDLATGPAVALGASEASLMQVTSSYAGILNGGQAVQPYGVIDLRLKGDSKPLMGMDGGPGKQVISQRSARELTYMMTKVVEEGTGRRAALDGWQVAGKTGTTSDYRDAWFVGFTAQYVTGVWMGYDDNSKLTGVTGGGLPAEIWHDAMARIHKNIPVTPLPMEAPSQLVADTGAFDAPADRGTRQQAPRGNLVDDLLRAIFGGN